MKANITRLRRGSKSALEAENAALWQQIIVLGRKLRGRVKLSNADRLFFVWLYRLFPSIARAMLIIHPDTLADAVTCEPVSTDKFPANREKNREFFNFGPDRGSDVAIRPMIQRT